MAGSSVLYSAAGVDGARGIVGWSVRFHVNIWWHCCPVCSSCFIVRNGFTLDWTPGALEVTVREGIVENVRQLLTGTLSQGKTW